MAADVKTEQFFLIGEFFMLAPRFDWLPSHCCRSVRLFIEKRNLSGCPITLRYRRRVQRFIDAREELRAIPPRKIERAGLDRLSNILRLARRESSRVQKSSSELNSPR